MLRKLRRLAAALALLGASLLGAGSGSAQHVAGEFDYYVLSLSWSPGWCAIEGDARAAPQCDHGAGHGWILHGLWPQYESGWPSDCRTGHAPPSRAMTTAMADIMGSSGLAWHQWRKHGSCSGLSPADYFLLSRLAYGGVEIPPVFQMLSREVALPASVVEEAFLASNPELSADQITITCRDGHIQEARICLTRELDFRRCGADAIRDCTLSDARLPPVR